MSSDPLLQPYQLRHLTLRNRLMITSHEPAYPEDGMPKERYRAYHVERAKAGVALTMTAGSASVARDSPPVFNNILAWKDEVVGWMKQLVDECHDHGAAVMIQLTHLGRRTRWDKGDWLPVAAPTMEREPSHRAFPKLIEKWDIERIKSDFADAAERMKAAGVDGIDFESFGHLLSQFWSPMSNHLDNEYGGSLANRSRFAIELIKAVRAAVGPDFPIIFRFSQWKQQDYTARLVQTPEELGAFLKPLSDAGVDIFHCSTRRFWEPEFEGSDLNLAGWTRQLTGKPTITVGSVGLDGEFLQFMVNTDKVAEPASLENLLERLNKQEFDLVAVGRALLVDPDWAVKVRDGRESDILPFSREALKQLV
mgnify:CR=1 FL=1